MINNKNSGPHIEGGWPQLIFGSLTSIVLWSLIALVSYLFKPLNNISILPVKSLPQPNLAITILWDILSAYFSLFSILVITLVSSSSNLAIYYYKSFYSLFGFESSEYFRVGNIFNFKFLFMNRIHKHKKTLDILPGQIALLEENNKLRQILNFDYRNAIETEVKGNTKILQKIDLPKGRITFFHQKSLTSSKTDKENKWLVDYQFINPTNVQGFVGVNLPDSFWTIATPEGQKIIRRLLQSKAESLLNNFQIDKDKDLQSGNSPVTLDSPMSLNGSEKSFPKQQYSLLYNPRIYRQHKISCYPPMVAKRINKIKEFEAKADQTTMAALNKKYSEIIQSTCINLFSVPTLNVKLNYFRGENNAK